MASIVEEIEGQLKKSLARREQLGEARETRSAQMQWLLKLAHSYTSTIEKALEGNYMMAVRDKKSPMKLRMHQVNAAEDFNYEMLKDGATIPFQDLTVSQGQNVVPVIMSETGDQDNDIYEVIRKEFRSNRGSELPGKLSRSNIDVRC